ncbi:hypothetical protein I635_06945 [Alteromonas mediterranea UM7]|nr:hypothetical protein I635_06945 [Alteromonas mediterranea UM7]
MILIAAAFRIAFRHLLELRLKRGEFLGLDAGMFRPDFNAKELHTIVTVCDMCFLRVYAEL